MNNSDITKKPNKSNKRRFIFVACFILFLITATIVYSLFQLESKPDPDSDRIILEAAAKMLDVDPNYFVDYDYFEEVYRLNVSNMPFPFSRTLMYPKMMYISDGSTITPIFGLVEISDIRYIEKFLNLESVYLKIRFPKKDIPKWMINLSMLGVLDLNKKFSIDLKPLAKLHHLKMIDFAGSQIKDIQPLEGLDKLEELVISHTPVYNIKPIRKLTQLKHLDISNTEVSNFEPIGELTNLEKLFLSNTKVSNLDFLKKLKHLYKLDLCNCKNITNEQIEDLQKVFPNLEIVK